PDVLVLAPARCAVVLPAHEGVRAGAVLADMADGRAIGLHRPARTVGQVDLHAGGPAGVGVAVVAHPAAGPVETLERAAAQLPAHVDRRPTLGVAVLWAHEAEEAGRRVRMPEDVLD